MPHKTNFIERFTFENHFADIVNANELFKERSEELITQVKISVCIYKICQINSMMYGFFFGHMRKINPKTQLVLTWRFGRRRHTARSK